MSPKKTNKALNEIQGRKDNKDEKEKGLRGMSKDINSIMEGLPRSKNPSKGRIKRRIFELLTVTRKEGMIHEKKQKRPISDSWIAIKWMVS